VDNPLIETLRNLKLAKSSNPKDREENKAYKTEFMK
jgi:hypothetical protein